LTGSQPLFIFQGNVSKRDGNAIIAKFMADEDKNRTFKETFCGESGVRCVIQSAYPTQYMPQIQIRISFFYLND